MSGVDKVALAKYIVSCHQGLVETGHRPAILWHLWDEHRSGRVGWFSEQEAMDSLSANKSHCSPGSA